MNVYIVIWDKVSVKYMQKGTKNQVMHWLIQSVKTTYYGENHGYDGEKTKGRKRHIVTDVMGNLLCIHVHAANIHNTKGGIILLMNFITSELIFLCKSKNEKDFRFFQNVGLLNALSHGETVTDYQKIMKLLVVLQKLWLWFLILLHS